MNYQRLFSFISIFNLLMAFCQAQPSTENWPMWRYSATRSAYSHNQLPNEFHLLWQKSFAARQPAWDDPLNQDLMSYDRVFEPIVMAGKLIVSFNDQDKLVAFDMRSGQACWTFFTEAPIRLAPAGWQDRLFAGSDDGYLYCIDVNSGVLLWKFQAAPSKQHALGNKRLTSAWPVRGGPVVRDGVVYFAASIWPFMGSFIYALDAQTGAVVWINDNTGSQYIKQPHSAPSFAGVGPQGSLVATEKQLIVPGGRSVPAVFDRADGKFNYFEINAGGKGSGGAIVIADDKHFYVHTRQNGTRAFDIATGVKTAFTPNRPVIHGDWLYAAHQVDGQQYISCYPANQENLDNREAVWSIAADASDELIGAGQFLVASGAGVVSIVRLPNWVDGQWTGGQLVQQIAIGQRASRMLVADQRLVVVTDSGEIRCYGQSGLQPPATQENTAGDGKSRSVPAALTIEKAEQRVRSWAAAEGAEGYAFWFGPCKPAWLDAWAKHSPFVQLAIVDSDAERVGQMRRRLDELGVYGKITVHHATPRDFMPPQFVAHRVFVSKPKETAATEEDWLASYGAVRPYGGQMIVVSKAPVAEQLTQQISALNLEQASVTKSPWGLTVTRQGALSGAADWTHQNGDIANTLKSQDSRAKMPLGVLWFGGSSNMDVLPRHGHGPPQQVVGGRLVIQGMNSLSARDVYTGRVLWHREFSNLGTFEVYYDATYDNTPLDPKYNQVHIPGANARGTNYVVTEDRVYIVVENQCWMLDVATGKDLGRISIPSEPSGEQPEWGFIGIYKDILLGGVGFAKYRSRDDLEFETDKLLTGSKAGFSSKSLDRAASRALVAYDRHTGEQLWRLDATHSFWHNGIVAGGDRVYCLDRNPKMVEEALTRRGINKQNKFRVVSVDYRTGKPLWQVDQEVTGTWLGYSQQYDSLLLARAPASDRLVDESGTGMRVYDASNGSVRWSNDELVYNGPCILHNQWIITNTNSYAQSAGAFDILTGQHRMTKNPLTGQPQPWKITRAYGCNNIIASEHLLTFRSGAAGYYDLLTDSGTGNLGGFKSGCTSNLVVAGGVLNAPDYTRTCSCAYQNQTSLALIHMPGLDNWTIHPTAVNVPENEIIRTLGINFGAPGDRRDQDGLLWLEYPVIGGDSPQLAITINEDVQFFQRHSSRVTDSQLPWVMASGATNIRELRLLMRTQKRPGPAPAVKVKSDDSDAAAATSAPAEPAIELYQDPIPTSNYRVELFFSMPLEFQSQEHQFVVSMAGQQQSVSLKNDASSEGQVSQRLIFEKVPLEGELLIQFQSQQGITSLSGIKLIQIP